MAPEQWEDVHGCDGRTDLYALGCTVFFLLVGRPPYGGEEYKTAPRKMLGHINDAIPDLKALRGDVPDEAERHLSPDDGEEGRSALRHGGGTGPATSPWATGGDVLTQLPGSRPDRTNLLPAAQTVPEKTAAVDQVRSASGDKTQGISPAARLSPTMMEPLANAAQTSVVPPKISDDKQTPRWLWPAIGGMAAVVLVTVGLVWLMNRGPNATPPGDSKSIAKSSETSNPPDPIPETPVEPSEPNAAPDRDAPEVSPEPETPEPVDVAADEPLDPVMAEEPPVEVAVEVPVMTIVGPIIVPDPVVPPEPFFPDAEPNPPIVMQLPRASSATIAEDQPIEPEIVAESEVQPAPHRSPRVRWSRPV